MSVGVGYTHRNSKGSGMKIELCSEDGTPGVSY